MNIILIVPFLFLFLHVMYVLTAYFIKRPPKRSQINQNRFKIEHIVCFKNEKAFIQKKLESLKKLNLSHEIHHTFIDDNSDDNTYELLQQHKFENCSIIQNTENLGKNQSQIKAVNQTQSDFLLFTDANVFITGETVERLIDAFDDNTGGVTGNVKITTDLENQDFSGKYWEVEKKIKAFQTRFKTVIGFDGGLYCVKRKNYNLSRENELSDFETAFLIFEQKKDTKYVHEAVAVELEKRTIKNSLKSRIRACNRVFWSFYRIFKYLPKLDTRVIFHFFMHKIIRYAAAVTYVLCLPLILFKIISSAPLLLLFFFLPPVIRLSLECISLFIGGLIALSGKEYTTWSQAKK